MRALPGLRRLPLPGSRVRGAARGRRRRRSRDALQRLGGIAEPPLEPIVPCEPEVFHYRNKLEYSFTQTPTTGRRSASTGPAAGTRCSTSSKCWLDDRPRQRRSATPCATGRARRGSRRTTQEDAHRLPPPPRRPRGPQHGPGARPARDRAGRALRPRLLRRGAAPLPRGALDPLVGERHAGRGDEPADELLWGEECDRGGARRAALPRPPERVPADEHRDGRAALRARARGRAG